MDPLPSDEIESSPPPNPPTITTTSIAMPDDDNNKPLPISQQPEQHQEKNPSSPLQTLESADPVPPNPDQDLHLLQSDPDDPEDMPIPLMSDSNVEKRGRKPHSSSSRRGIPRRKKKGTVQGNQRKLAAIEKKVRALTEKWKVIPFVRNKALDFTRHEENLRRLGLWDFAHLEFDRKIRADLLAKLIVNYSVKDRCSFVDDVKVMVNGADLARALSLSKKPKPADSGEEEEVWPGDFIVFVDEFVSNWMLLHEDTWMLPQEVLNWTGMIKEGHPEKVDWVKLIWFMVKREVSKGPDLENCYYASHLQQLIRFQKEGLLREKSPDEVDEVIVVKEDEEEEGDVEMTDCVEVSQGGELEIVLPSVGGIDSVQSEQNAENAVNLGVVGNASNAENPETSGDHVVSLEKVVEHVEIPEKVVEHVEIPEKVVEDVEIPKKVAVELVETHVKAVEHVETQNKVDDHIEIPAKAVELVETQDKVDDHAEIPAKADKLVETPDKVDDHVEIPAKAVELVETQDKVDDHVEIPAKAVELVETPDKVVEPVEIPAKAVEHVEVLETVVDDVEIRVKAVEHVEVPETAVENVEKVVEDVENPDKAVEHVKFPEKAVENVEKAVEHVGNLEKDVDKEEDMETADDHVINLDKLETATDHVDKEETAGDLVTKLETAGEFAEIMNVIRDYSEDMKIDGDNVEDVNLTGDDDVYEFKTEDDDDDAQIQETSGNDLMEFEPMKADDEQDLWDLSRKDGEQEHFLRHCSMNEVRQEDDQPEEVEVEDDEDEDDEQIQGFNALQKCNSFSGLSSGHLMQAIDPSQMHYSAPDFSDNHLMLGGPSSSSIFGNAPKRELEHNPEMPLNDNTHKRMRTEAPPDFDWCMNQTQQWIEKARMAYASSQETIANQQQMFSYDLNNKDLLIQQLKLNIEELQRSHHSQITRYENELYSMNNVVSGYRKALKSTQQNFAEYRKRAPLPLEPLYRDAGEGGVVKSVADLEKERLKREEEERLARIAFTRMAEKLDEDWAQMLKAHLERVEMIQERVSGIAKAVELLKESFGKRKEASETAGLTDPAPLVNV